MRTVSDVLAHCKFLVDKGHASEPAELFLPRKEAARRRVNKEKRHRIVFEVDETGYSEWHAEKERWYSLIPNKTICLHVMVRVLGAVQSGTIRFMGGEYESRSAEVQEAAAADVRGTVPGDVGGDDFGS